MNTVFTSGSVCASLALSLHCYIPRSDNGQSSKVVSCIIDTYLSAVSVPFYISSAVFSHLRLKVEFACLMIINFEV